MKKFFLTGAITLSLLLCNTTADAAHYFTQGDAQGSDTPYGDNTSVGNYAKTADAKIYYEVYGKGSPILILHGGGVGSPYELGKMLDVLKENHKLIVVSTRGHGRSEIGHSTITYKQKADDVIAVLDDLKLNEPVQIIGFSDGAYAAYEVAALYPERVDRVAAIGAGTLEAGYFPDSLDFNALASADKRFIDEQRKIQPEPKRWENF